MNFDMSVGMVKNDRIWTISALKLEIISKISYFMLTFYLTFLDYILQLTKIFHHLYSRLFMFYIEGEEENKINEIESQWKGKFLYKPFIPLPNLSDYLGSIIKVSCFQILSNLIR